MVTAAEKERFEHIASLAGWDVAKAYGVHYNGDSNPIEHGGYFYSVADWEEYGYADAVEFWFDEENGRLFVQRGTINKLKDDEMTRLIESTYNGDADPANIHVQIDVCKGQWGMEPDDHCPAKRFKLDDWREWRIWRSVDGMLNALAG